MLIKSAPKINIIITKTTIEGAPVTTTATVSQGAKGCTLEVTIDSSKDKFSDGKVHTYTCHRLTQKNQELLAGECTDGPEMTSLSI